ncbi:MAG TPA: hypothetical protein VK465_08285, partial [Fibrobacteria bacterium]|nr:hypothetical protein [Fibrobacteria bacterium]
DRLLKSGVRRIFGVVQRIALKLLRLSPGLKLTHVVDLGWDLRRESGSPLEDEPVVAVRSSFAWFF